MSRTHAKDTIELLHDYGLHPASRTIVLDTSYDSGEGGDDGVNHFMATRFLKNFLLLETANKEPITIILNTVGGSVCDGMAIYDRIKASECEVTIKVYGQASSMGSIILQAADHRVLSPHALVMYHVGNTGVGGVNPHEAFAAMKWDKEFADKLSCIQLERINEKRQRDGQSPWTKAKFIDMNFKGGYLFAEQAVELGLADTIE